MVAAPSVPPAAHAAPLLELGRLPRPGPEQRAALHRSRSVDRCGPGAAAHDCRCAGDAPPRLRARRGHTAMTADLIAALQIVAATAGWTAGLFFFRFWRDTRDRLFLLFGTAFWLLSLTWVLLALL